MRPSHESIITLEWCFRRRRARGHRDKRTHGKLILPEWLQTIIARSSSSSSSSSVTLKHSGGQAAGNRVCREMKYTDAQSFQFEKGQWVIRELEEKHSGRKKKEAATTLNGSQAERMVYSWAHVRGRGCCSRGDGCGSYVLQQSTRQRVLRAQLNWASRFLHNADKEIQRL